MSQPTGPGQYGAQPPYQGAPPNNYLVWAILATVLCCLPLGVPAIVFSSQVNSKWAAGDAAGALEASNKAKQFSIWAAIAGIVVVVGYLIFLFALGGLALLQAGQS
ncbi:interferon-induced transmembrane protein [Propionicimonas paludicola]|uniref:Interferon-induced transmembrane protein n=1 Tax=Propionicimonas paludicola TaxID=185243 RepID=A0A2A9CQD2_9ACTN|nr:CD225/dispanin family protein [Propionicimonas paludicola]PFG15749.1 interferon-induced transmembrane protein [Propionicimonas paludicola]